MPNEAALGGADPRPSPDNRQPRVTVVHPLASVAQRGKRG